MRESGDGIVRVMRIIARMNIGGPAIQISGLMEGISSKHFLHVLYTGNCTPDEKDYLESTSSNIPAIKIKSLGRNLNFKNDVLTLIILVREIRRLKPHIIHTHTFKAGFLGRVASLISFQKSIRVHTYHGHLLDSYFGYFKRYILIFLERLLSIFTHQLVAVGEKVKLDLLGVGIGTSKKFIVIPPGITINKLPSKLDSMQYFNLDPSKLYCAFIGRFTSVKRLDRFLDVAYETKKRNIGVNFILVGNGYELPEIEERIKHENLPVKVLGWQVNIEKVLTCTDIVMLTSDNEGTPISLVQASMAGIPVISTDVGSVSEVVLNNETGILTSKNILEIADAIETLSQDETLRKKLGKNGRLKSFKKFGTERMIKDHEKLYKNLLIKPIPSPQFKH